MSESLVVRGAREHNLKNIDIDIPRNKLVVFSGLSGSGKSSLAFDTIFAEGQRRYVESLSSYARQFLGQMDKPSVDLIEGLSPAVSIDQKSTNRNPRSTVGTITEVYDYLRLLFSRTGEQHCPVCGELVASSSAEQIVDTLLAQEAGTRFQLLAPVVQGRKGEHADLLSSLRSQGYARARVDGTNRRLDEEITLDKVQAHHRSGGGPPRTKPDSRRRLTDSVETALLAEGILVVDCGPARGRSRAHRRFSEKRACPNDHPLDRRHEPRTFLQRPLRRLPRVHRPRPAARGRSELVIPMRASLTEGAIAPWTMVDRPPPRGDGRPRRGASDGHAVAGALARPGRAAAPKDFKVHVVPQPLAAAHLLHRLRGVMRFLERRHSDTESDWAKERYEQFMRETPCPACKGARPRPGAGRDRGRPLDHRVCEMSIGDALAFHQGLELGVREAAIADEVLREIRSRLGFLLDVGLDYLSLARAAGTLSGGEAQRIRLATQIGSGLVGVLYVLDEPSIGLHQRDNERLIATLERLRDLGNTLIVVEHDEDTLNAADWIVDIGPLAGEHGGRVVHSGDVGSLKQNPGSLTGRYLSGELEIPLPADRRPVDRERMLTVVAPRANNLAGQDVAFPLGVLTAITGVSGSGKSTLVNDILYSVLAKELNRARVVPGRHKRVTGLEHLDKVVHVDQSPIGRTPRSNPATYTGVWDRVRTLFAQTNEAKIRGYTAGRFSFNVKGGRCEACSGDGTLKIEMNFLPDVYVQCEVCKGQRYNRETLEVKFKDKNVAEVLGMPIAEALEFFDAVPAIRRQMQTLVDVGLGYVKLGQSATTLSGGEAQRVKLSSELHKRSNGRTIYVLDEPTTGLHFEDVRKLLEVLGGLVDKGNTVIVIEHNLDVIKTADHVIDLGPEGGAGGGRVVATGTPEQVAETPGSYTGHFLAPMIATGRAGRTPRSTER